MKYGQNIYEYLFDIYSEFENLNIHTFEDLCVELEKRVHAFLDKNYTPEIAAPMKLAYAEGTNRQECSKVIMNDFKRLNFSVTNPIDEKFNLFYYKDYPEGIEGIIKRGDNPGLKIAKFNSAKFPENLVVYWKKGQKKKDLARNHYTKK